MLSKKNTSKLESRTLSQYTLLDIVDFEDTIRVGEKIFLLDNNVYFDRRRFIDVKIDSTKVSIFM